MTRKEKYKMTNNIIKLNDKIIKQRDKLHTSINESSNESVIYQNSIDLDILIEEYLKNIKQQEEFEKYKDILNRDFKDEILEQIREDVKTEIKDMSDTELEYYCNNIYVYACLKANNINDNEIVKQLMYRNIVIAGELEKNNIENANIPTEFNSIISNKYYEIIKEKIK